jgi:hypothetical protein
MLLRHFLARSGKIVMSASHKMARSRSPAFATRGEMDSGPGFIGLLPIFTWELLITLLAGCRCAGNCPLTVPPDSVTLPHSSFYTAWVYGYIPPLGGKDLSSFWRLSVVLLRRILSIAGAKPHPSIRHDFQKPLQV